MKSILTSLRSRLRFVFSKLPYLIVLSFASLTGCSALKPINLLNAAVPSTGYTLQQNIAYGEDKRQKLDIYQPVTPAARSRTIVFVHGGAWREGNGSEYKFVGQALADAGHTVIIPEYRLFPAVAFPFFISDVADAITAVKDHAEQWLDYPLDQVILMGHSSGAHTVALLASDPRWLENSGVTPRALIAISGPYDLPLDNPEVAPVFRNAPIPDEVRPVMLVTSAHPPTLLIHGEDDKRVRPFHTRNYAASLIKADIPVDVHWLKDKGHAAAIAGLAAPLDSSHRNRERITSFLDGLCDSENCARPDKSTTASSE